MKTIDEIMSMLDWTMPLSIQEQGRILANDITDIRLFLQPTTSKDNKNVWDNCAAIISNKSDMEITPYLISLLEWLQDINWPGAEIIFQRLINFKDKDTLSRALDTCFTRAKEDSDTIWYNHLMLLKKS